MHFLQPRTLLVLGWLEGKKKQRAGRPCSFLFGEEVGFKGLRGSGSIGAGTGPLYSVLLQELKRGEGRERIRRTGEDLRMTAEGKLEERCARARVHFMLS